MRKPISPRVPVAYGSFGSWHVSLHRDGFTGHELAQRYDFIAADWHQKISVLGMQAAYEDILRAVMSREPGVYPGSVLDCGVGTGAMSLAFQRIAQAPFRLDAVDLSPRMTEEARRAFWANGIEASVHQADIEALPFRDDQFDLVMSAHVIEHLGDPSVALSEMVRVLKPGGKLVACLTGRTILSTLIQLKWRTHRLSDQDCMSLLRNAGLIDAQTITPHAHAHFHRLSLACFGRKPGLDEKAPSADQKEGTF